MPYVLPNCMQMNFQLLGNSTVPDACQHVEVTQTKEAVESSGNFLLFFSVDAMGPAVSLRLLCEDDTLGSLSPGCSMHQMFVLTFALSCRGTANRCLHLPGLRGRFRGWSYIVISHFKFNFSPRLRSCQLQATAMSLHYSFISWF